MHSLAVFPSIPADCDGNKSTLGTFNNTEFFAFVNVDISAITIIEHMDMAFQHVEIPLKLDNTEKMLIKFDKNLNLMLIVDKLFMLFLNTETNGGFSWSLFTTVNLESSNWQSIDAILDANSYTFSILFDDKVVVRSISMTEKSVSIAADSSYIMPSLNRIMIVKGFYSFSRHSIILWCRTSHKLQIFSFYPSKAKTDVCFFDYKIITLPEAPIRISYDNNMLFVSCSRCLSIYNNYSVSRIQIPNVYSLFHSDKYICLVHKAENDVCQLVILDDQVFDVVYSRSLTEISSDSKFKKVCELNGRSHITLCKSLLCETENIDSFQSLKNIAFFRKTVIHKGAFIVYSQCFSLFISNRFDSFVNFVINPVGSEIYSAHDSKVLIHKVSGAIWISVVGAKNYPTFSDFVYIPGSYDMIKVVDNKMYALYFNENAILVVDLATFAHSKIACDFRVRDYIIHGQDFVLLSETNELYWGKERICDEPVRLVRKCPTADSSTFMVINEADTTLYIFSLSKKSKRVQKSAFKVPMKGISDFVVDSGISLVCRTVEAGFSLYFFVLQTVLPKDGKPVLQFFLKQMYTLPQPCLSLDSCFNLFGSNDIVTIALHEDGFHVFSVQGVAEHSFEPSKIAHFIPDYREHSEFFPFTMMGEQISKSFSLTALHMIDGLCMLSGQSNGTGMLTYWENFSVNLENESKYQFTLQQLIESGDVDGLKILFKQWLKLKTVAYPMLDDVFEPVDEVVATPQVATVSRFSSIKKKEKKKKSSRLGLRKRTVKLGQRKKPAFLQRTTTLSDSIAPKAESVIANDGGSIPFKSIRDISNTAFEHTTFSDTMHKLIGVSQTLVSKSSIDPFGLAFLGEVELFYNSQRLKATEEHHISFIALLNALLSTSQSIIIDECLGDSSHSKYQMTVTDAFNELKPCFWIKDTVQFNGVLEKIISHLFVTSSRDPMSILLWLVLLDDVDRVVSIAKSQNIKPLVKFFGRNRSDRKFKKMATNNAFAAITKHKYHLAVAMFLLADDVPMAFNIILRRLQDPHLYFTVCRCRNIEPEYSDELEALCLNCVGLGCEFLKTIVSAIQNSQTISLLSDLRVSLRSMFCFDNPFSLFHTVESIKQLHLIIKVALFLLKICDDPLFSKHMRLSVEEKFMLRLSLSFIFCNLDLNYVAALNLGRIPDKCVPDTFKAIIPAFKDYFRTHMVKPTKKKSNVDPTKFLYNKYGYNNPTDQVSLHNLQARKSLDHQFNVGAFLFFCNPSTLQNFAYPFAAKTIVALLTTAYHEYNVLVNDEKKISVFLAQQLSTFFKFADLRSFNPFFSASRALFKLVPASSFQVFDTPNVQITEDFIRVNDDVGYVRRPKDLITVDVMEETKSVCQAGNKLVCLTQKGIVVLNNDFTVLEHSFYELNRYSTVHASPHGSRIVLCRKNIIRIACIPSNEFLKGVLQHHVFLTKEFQMPNTSAIIQDIVFINETVIIVVIKSKGVKGSEIICFDISGSYPVGLVCLSFEHDISSVVLCKEYLVAFLSDKFYSLITINDGILSNFAEGSVSLVADAATSIGTGRIKECIYFKSHIYAFNDTQEIIVIRDFDVVKRYPIEENEGKFVVRSNNLYFVANGIIESKVYEAIIFDPQDE
ncbi:hypothetical protein PCE1_000548 [Barthelona sp. PCE]